MHCLVNGASFYVSARVGFEPAALRTEVKHSNHMTEYAEVYALFSYWKKSGVFSVHDKAYSVFFAFSMPCLTAIFTCSMTISPTTILSSPSSHNFDSTHSYLRFCCGIVNMAKHTKTRWLLNKVRIEFVSP